MKVVAAAAALGALATAATVVSPCAYAADWALNGTYLATSNGDMAQTNDVYRNEAPVRSTWTISMTCSNATTCAGRVSSDAGWSADITAKGSEYVVLRELPGWEPCVDGGAVTGHQRYLFYPVDPETSFLQLGSPVLGGYDKTTGESGGCRLSDKLEIQMPFRLEKLS